MYVLLSYIIWIHLSICLSIYSYSCIYLSIIFVYFSNTIFFNHSILFNLFIYFFFLSVCRVGKNVGGQWMRGRGNGLDFPPMHIRVVNKNIEQSKMYSWRTTHNIPSPFTFPLTRALMHVLPALESRISGKTQTDSHKTRCWG